MVALAESDEETIDEFIKLVKIQTPKLARVDEIAMEEYSGEVMDLWRFSEINTSAQMNKAVEFGLKDLPPEKHEEMLDDIA